MSSLLKKRLLQKRRDKHREHVLENVECSIALKNKIGATSDEFLKALMDKKCALVATILDGDTGFQMGLCNLDIKKDSSKKIYAGMIAANIQYYAMQFGVSTDKVLGDIAGALSSMEQVLGIE